MKTLVVDSSRAMRLVLSKALRHAGVARSQVDECATDEDALHHLRNDPPAWLFCEGPSLVAEARALGFRGGIGVVASNHDAEARSVALAAGADVVLRKPVRPEDLRRALEDGASNVDGTVAGVDSVPTLTELATHLGKLLDRHLATQAFRPRLPTPAEPAYAAFFDGPEHHPERVLALVELDLAVHAACVLTQYTRGTAARCVEAVRSGAPLPDEVRQNLRAIFDVIGGLFVGKSEHPFTLRELRGPVDGGDREMRAVALGTRARICGAMTMADVTGTVALFRRIAR